MFSTPAAAPLTAFPGYEHTPGTLYLRVDLAAAQLPRDADANKGPSAVWSGRPTQREEGGKKERQPLEPQETPIFGLSAGRYGGNTPLVRDLKTPRASATEVGAILTGGEGGWSRISAPVSL